MGNYTPYHLHSDLSLVSGCDSVTKFDDYIQYAKNLGMGAMAFSEHGNLFGWFSKKQAIEKAGLKYIHASEVYVTESLDEKIRDNYHLILIAKNYQGFLELNRLVSKSFNREDGHYYYSPRITFKELFGISDNLILTTACIGGVLGRGSAELQQSMLDYMSANADRCFLEIQHHNVDKQKEYNLRMIEYSKQYGIPLIAGSDTHSLNEKHAEGRVMLQRAKKVFFDDEEGWDLTFKTYDELLDAYAKQGVVDSFIYIDAIENTNRMADMVETFTIDRSNKYPQIYDNPIERFREEVEAAIKLHPTIHKVHTQAKIREVVDTEFDAYVKTGAHEFMLLENYKLQWERANNIHRGVGRGSVNGSFIAYVLGITKMDSIKFDLNFFRFINPDRVSLADIDTDYGSEDRDKVKGFILKDKMNLSNLRSSEIITFNTLALKGSIKDIGRALEMPLDVTDAISNEVEEDENQQQFIDPKWREKYPILFYYVDIVQGTIVSIGSHPSGVLLSDLDIEETIGMCSVAQSDYPVSMLDMKELDALNYVKMDILGLDNIAVINDTCALAGIPLITPDNIDLEDEKVWNSIHSDTAAIFQWNSPMGTQYMNKFFSETTLQRAKEQNAQFSYLKWFSFANGALRPGCASFRDEIAEGKIYDNGMPEINQFFSDTLGRCVFQEQVMKFLTTFCGYSGSEADNVRRAVSKKKGTDKLLPEIERRFVDFVHKKYGYEKDYAHEVIQSFLKVVEDASSYMFSSNHSDAYSYIGYACGYLRHYYPLEFITTALNVFRDKEAKTIEVTNYAAKHGIRVKRPKFRYSKSEYYMDRETNSVYKGLESIKYMNASVADEMQRFYGNKYPDFVALLRDLATTSINTKQLDILIKIGFFNEFGNVAELLQVNNYYAKYGSSKVIKKDTIEDEIIRSIIARNARETDRQYRIDGNIQEILAEIGQYILSLDLPDLSVAEKIQYQKEHLGYVDLSTGKLEDATKLVIVDITAMKTKDKKKIWAYKLETSSLGSGKRSELMLSSRVYDQNPIRKYDIIFTKVDWLEKQTSGKYVNWYLKSYRKVNS